MTSLGRMQDPLEEISRYFLEGLPANLDALSASLAATPARFDDGLSKAQEIALLSDEAGLPEIGRTCRALVAFLTDLAADHALFGPRMRGALEQYVDAIRVAALSALRADSQPSPIPPFNEQAFLRLSTSAESSTEDWPRRVIVISPDRASMNSFAEQLVPVGYTVEWVAHPAELPLISEHRPRTVLAIHTGFLDDTERTDWLHSDQWQTHSANTTKVFFGRDGSLPVRLAALRAGARGFVPFPPKARSVVAQFDMLTGGVNFPPDRVLVVDDSRTVAQFYADVLTEAGMIARPLSSPMEVLTVMEDFAPDLILMDLHMPSCNGDELITVIRQQEEWVGIPIVVVSGDINDARHLHAMRCGASDFLRKPVHPDHLVERVVAHTERHRILRMQMSKDGLTGLLNHARLHEAIDIETRRAVRNQQSLVLAIIDLDHFKQVNDRHGHQAGDVVLRNISRLLVRRLRQTDIAGRYGGEEFCILLPDTSLADTETLLEQLRDEFAALEHRFGDKGFQTTFSVGIALCGPDDDGDALFYRADKALYRAKRGGRNRVRVELPARAG
ncbi:diguanylate cyclase [Chitinimonas sp. BJYL2]|uniref:GGDEF domain-containing response regulator n=1 Tax=Chitinimonas sp. BJYL2 TaxID=2976696 RepID=UPI0022B455FE|nr:diguanylate cyclase [Chitinimonas sp. BJYL2]